MHCLEISTGAGFSLAETVAPVAWGGGRWPNQDWREGRLIAVSTEQGQPCIRVVAQVTGEHRLILETNRPELNHRDWAERVLGVHRARPAFTDPIIRSLAAQFPGMRPYSNGDLFEGIVTAIVGQSISVQAAAVTERKLAELFAEPIAWEGRSYWPTPTRDQLARAQPEIVRRSGVTQRRADAIVRIAGMMTENQSPLSDVAHGDEQALVQSLMNLPQVGRWTAESVLLWGLGVDDAYPIRDVALLRAARLGYDRPGMTHGEMDHLSEGWRPGRSWAARLLWLNLFGPAPLFRAPD
jgi:3-methyladenine DNA glycosylase/8-oxoguanine DNA glycosylase